MYVVPDWDTNVALLQVTDVTPTLSVTTAVKLARLVWSLVVKLIVESFTEKLLIDGFWVSLLLIDTVTLSVEVLPAASVATIDTVSVLEPKL